MKIRICSLILVPVESLAISIYNSYDFKESKAVELYMSYLKSAKKWLLHRACTFALQMFLQ